MAGVETLDPPAPVRPFSADGGDSLLPGVSSIDSIVIIVVVVVILLTTSVKSPSEMLFALVGAVASDAYAASATALAGACVLPLNACILPPVSARARFESQLKKNDLPFGKCY